VALEDGLVPAEERAEALLTVQRQWRRAKAWLYHELTA
jgi:hypothetical protein